METTDEQRRELAIKRIKEKNAFKAHLAVYLLVNALLVAIWAGGGSAGVMMPGLQGNFFWPIFPILGWGLGVAIHGYITYRGNAYSEEQIQREMRNLPK